MQMPQIRMESTMGRIGMTQTMAQIAIEQRKAEMTIEQPKAEMDITTTKGRLTIDQTQAWEEMNLMSTRRSIEKNKQEAHKQLQEGTTRRAEQGAQLLDIHKSDTIIADQARENQWPPLKTPTIKYVPSSFDAVKFHYERGEVHIDIRPQKPIIDVQINRPEITYYPGSVEVMMEQYPELKIDFEPLYV